jgi:hypothetical protein
MIKNSFRGKCACGQFVPAGDGYVNGRRIVCADCAAILDDGFTMHGLDDEPEDTGRGRYGFDE